MEDRHHLKPPRTGHTVIEDAPNEKHSHHHKRVLLGVGVGMSMVIVLALYAASFRYRDLVPDGTGELSRWGVAQEEFMNDSKSLLDGFKDISGAVSGVLNANRVRAESITLMKDKLASSSTDTPLVDSATNAPQSELEENPPTEY